MHFESAAVAERQFVTLLFADLCDSTSQVAKVDPEEAQAILDRVLLLMTRAVDTYGGRIHRLQGDGIVGLFGSPTAHEDHALRACLSALAIQRDARQESGGVDPMRLRIGIHSGEVVVGSVSGLLTSHHRVDGAAIHLAARLEELAPPGGALLTAATLRLLDGELDVRLVGRVALRGFDEPVEVHELLQDSPRSAAGPLARRRALAPLVGRGVVLDTLHILAQRAATGAMSVVGVRGDPGIGKSRLLEQFCTDAQALGFSICTMSTRSYTNHLPFSGMADLMRALLGIKTHVDPKQERDTARALVSAYQGDATTHADAVSDLLDLGLCSAGWQALSPRQRILHIGEALLWHVQQRLLHDPLLIVIEDVFLADDHSLRLLESMLRKLVNRRVLVCMSYRPEFVPLGRDAPWFEEVWLGPLREAEARQLIGSLLGRHESLEPVVRHLLESADGNPFFLEHMGLTLVDNGSLVGSPGDYRYVGSDVRLDPSDTIAAVITSRVNRLPSGAKAGLEALAVLDDTATAQPIAAMLDQPVETIDAHLRLCISAGLLIAPREAGIEPARRQYMFRHALVRQVVGDRLTRPRRRMLHRAALAALRESLGEHVGERASVLADHAMRGEAWVEAAQYSLAAMSRSIARTANRDALDMMNRGLAAVQRLDDPAEQLPLELALRTEALGALMPRGQFEQMFMHLDRAQEITRRLGDARREATVGLQLAVLLWTRGKYQQGLQAAQRAAQAACQASNRRAQMTAAQVNLMLEHGLGRYAAVAEQARQVEQLFAVELAGHRIMPGWAILPSINVKSFHADALARMGQTVAAQTLCDLAYAELAQHEHPFSRSMLDFVQGCLWVRTGTPERAAALLQQALDDCATHDIPTMAPCIAGTLAEALGHLQHTVQAKALVERVIAEKTYLFAGLYTEFYLRYGLGVALACAGLEAEAQEQLRAAALHAHSYEQKGHEADALLAIGASLLRCGLREQASAELASSVSTAQECSMQGVATLAAALLEAATAPA